jgi:hypothetical protein
MTLCALPCEGLLLVGSRPTSLRAAPLLPFLASSVSSRSRAPLRSARTEVRGRCVPFRLRRPQRFFCGQRMARGISPPGCPRVTRSIGCPMKPARGHRLGSVSGSAPLAGRAFRMWSLVPVPLAGSDTPPDRSGGGFRNEALLLLLPPSRVGGWLEAPRRPITRSPSDLRPRFVRSLRFVRTRDGALGCPMDLGGGSGSSRSRSSPVVPSPSVTCALAGHRPTSGSFSTDESSRIRRCVATSGFSVPSLGLFPLRGSPPGLAWALARPLSDRGLPRSHPGAGFQCGPFLSSRIAPRGRSRTLARLRLFDSGGRFRFRSRPPWGSQRQRATVTTWRFVALTLRHRLLTALLLSAVWRSWLSSALDP